MQYCRQSFANLKNPLQIAGNLSKMPYTVPENGTTVPLASLNGN
jgi:hypothetical protein